MRACGLVVLGLFLPLACVDQHPGVGADADASASSTGQPPPDADLCALLARDNTANAIHSVRAFAAEHAASLVQVRADAPRRIGELHFADVTVETVLYGWGFLAGIRATVALEPAQAALVTAGSRWVVALSDARAVTWDQTALPTWGNITALIPADEQSAYADSLAWRPRALVAVVRIVARDEYRVTFDVVDVLRGTFPGRFSDNWLASWRLPYPDPSAATYILSTDGLGTAPGDVVLGSVMDLRPATEAALAMVRAALAQAPADARAELRARRDAWLTGYRFHSAPVVVGATVTGRAEECCTNAGGTYVAHQVSSVMRGGAAELAGFVTGGHAYYGGEQCGDSALFGLRALLPQGVNALSAGFDCLTGGGMDPAPGQNLVSPVEVVLAGTPENRTRVAAWVASSPPVYRLHAPDTPLAEGDLEQNPAAAPWSTPVDAAHAYMSGTYAARFRVVSATRLGSAWRTRISTTLTLYEYAHLARREFDLFFACGEPALQQPGSRWVGAFEMLDPPSWDPAQTPAVTRGFLVPGSILPEHAMTAQLESDLARYLQP
ncbi:MAG: hypothetical protein HY904_07870 [Deltaproteobacteria bacterium]|nr:hypothetical protein [Deltaproteobacteria bacterium]